ncbi:class IIb bacteriocin, lactobin A/cerein 7B family [Capnocytophaga canis]|uniref:class IIb bacteriocin, lactobin A/cerein 7B family n=1 Tax=Capnocytophaga canis TaxID=1848903 RepID=UPI00370DA478
MTNKLTKQVEVQGMKKLDSIKGVQALNAQELKEIEGGWVVWAVIGIIAIIAYCAATDGNPDTVTRVNGRRVGN